MDGNVVGHLTPPSALDLPRRAQIGDVGDAQPAQLVASVLSYSAQLARPKEPAGPQTRGIGYISKVPRSVQLRHAQFVALRASGSFVVTAAANALFSQPISVRAMVRMCTSSGPSKIRIARCQAYSRASGVSSLTPAAPCTWMARSMTSQATCGATALICDTSRCAALLPCWSIVQAAFSHSRRAWSISLRDLAIDSRTTP